MKGANHPARTITHDLITIISLMMDGQDSLSFIRSAGNIVRGKRLHGRWLGPQAQAMVDENMRGFFLRDLWNEGQLFCSPMEVDTDGGGLATVGRLGSAEACWRWGRPPVVLRRRWWHLRVWWSPLVLDVGLVEGEAACSDAATERGGG
jgi:hypothetical protein